MLFTFPRTGYIDGTYIEVDGSYQRLNDYKVEATGITEFDGYKFSNGWKLNVRGEEYTIVPKVDGMFNMFFFELLADIKDSSGNVVGYGFVELMRSVRNDHTDRKVAFKTKKK